MIKVVVVYHSGRGHTEAVAKAVVSGVAQCKYASAALYRAEEAIENIDELDDADALIFGTPTYMGTVSAELKRFMEASSGKYLSRKWQDKVAAGFTNSGGLSGDKLNTLFSITIFAAQHGMHWVNLGLLTGYCRGGDDIDAPDTLNRIGSYLGAQCFSFVDRESEEGAPPQSDLLTAEHLGKRVAVVAHQLKLGRKSSVN